MSQNYNYLSGVALNNQAAFLYEILNNDQCWMGFARGIPELQWGVNSLVYINSPIINKSNVDDGITFYDTNNILATYSASGACQCAIGTSPFNIVFNNLILKFINNNWAVVEGIPYNYYASIDSSKTYYLYRKNGNFFNPVQILNKDSVNSSFISTDCKLYSHNTKKYINNLQLISNVLGESLVTGLTIENTIFDNSKPLIKKSLTNDFLTLFDNNGNILIQKLTFVDPDVSSNNITRNDTIYTSNENEFVELKYTLNNTDYSIKVVVDNITNGIGIWNEELSSNSIVSIADGNPPALDVTYIKNKFFNKSIFDVRGLTPINANSIVCIKKLNSPDEYINYPVSGGFSHSSVNMSGADLVVHQGIIKTSTTITPGQIFKIQLENNSTNSIYLRFVVGDTITFNANNVGTITDINYVDSNTFIIVSIANNLTLTQCILQTGDLISSDLTYVNSIIDYVSLPLSEYEQAVDYGFTNALINLTIPISGANSPVEQIYRQMFISYNPKDSSGTNLNPTNGVYSVDNTLAPNYTSIFNPTKYIYDVGTIIYISNKISIYRKAISSPEQFIIIL